MNEKISLQDLVALLAEKANISKKDAETLVKECFDIMEEGLVKDKLLKVRNLGTFKLVWVEDRESVDVSTGEKVTIPAHYKATFSPDIELAEKVNVPYASLGSVEVEGNEFPEKIEDEEENEEEESEDETGMEEKIAGYFWKEPESEPEKEEVTESEEIESEPEKIAYIQEETESEQEKVESEPEEVVIEPTRLGYIQKEPENKEEIFEDLEELGDFEDEKDEKDEFYYSEEEYDEEYEPIEATNGLFWLFFLIVSLLILFFAGHYFCPMLGLGAKQATPDSIEILSHSVNKPETSANLEINIDSAALPVADISKKEAPVPKVETVDNQSSKTYVNKKYTVRRGNRLNTIALREYGHKAFWVYIYDENRNQIKNPDLIDPGMVINIPPAAKYGIDKNNPEAVRKALELERKYKP